LYIGITRAFRQKLGIFPVLSIILKRVDKGINKDVQAFFINTEGMSSGVLEEEIFILSIAILTIVGVISIPGMGERLLWKLD
jgi:hypothetical protein